MGTNHARRIFSTGLAASIALVLSVSCGSGSRDVVAAQAAPVLTIGGGSATTVYVGDTLQLTVTVHDGSGSPVTVSVVQWTSSAPNVASVTQSGTVRGVAPGTARITATANGASGSLNLTVQQVPAASVEITPPTLSLAVDDAAQLTAIVRDANYKPLSGRAVTWTSSDVSFLGASARPSG